MIEAKIVLFHFIFAVYKFRTIDFYLKGIAMHIHALTLMILQLNKLVDSGRYSDISILDVHRAIDEERVIEMLQERAGEDFDVSLINIYEGAREEYEGRLNQIYGGYAGDESRKWGVKNLGLCLLIAWTNEIIQIGDGLKF